MVKIVNYFPKPYPDELLYSVIARFQKHFGNSSPELLKSLWGNIKSPPNNHYQIDRLQKLVDNTSLGACYTARQLAFQHTLLPFYSAFSGRTAQNKLLDTMLYGFQKKIFGHVGTHLRKTGERSNLQFCPECIKSDMETYGEPYWHRIHQAPGVLVCPWHRIKLREKCPVCFAPFLKKGIQYVYLDDKCINGHDLSELISDELEGKTRERLISYAHEVYKLLTNEFCYEPELICKRYITKLRELGWVGLKGQMLQPSSFGITFVEYYSYEFLEMLESNIEMNLSYNWLFKMVRRFGFRNLYHPLRHLLIIQFLFGSLETFNAANTEYLPFGHGPWPCLNPAASHYRMSVVSDCNVYQGTSAKIHGVFQCECGYKYSRVGPDRANGDRYKSDHVISYGHVWEEKLGSLVDSKKMSMKDIGIRLKVNEKTVITYNRKRKERENKKVVSRSKIYLYQETYRKKIQQIMIEIPNISRRQILKLATKEYRWLKNHDQEWLMNILPESKIKVQPYLKTYRKSILNVIQQNPDLNRTQIKNLASQEYYWLKMNDREWLMSILPKPKERRKIIVDWNLRDREFSNLIKIEAENILNLEGKPQRISRGAILKRLPSRIGAFLKSPTSSALLPEAQACLRNLTETTDEYQIRCILWAAKELDKLGQNLTEVGIKKLLSKSEMKLSMMVKQYIKDIISNGNIVHIR